MPIGCLALAYVANTQQSMVAAAPRQAFIQPDRAGANYINASFLQNPTDRLNFFAFPRESGDVRTAFEYPKFVTTRPSHEKDADVVPERNINRVLAARPA